MPSHTVSEHTQYTLERDRWEAELERSRQRKREGHERPQTRQVVLAPDEYWVEVDGRVEQKAVFILEL